PGGPAQHPDRRLAMDAGDRDDLVQESVLLGTAGGLLVPQSLDGRVLPQARSCHGDLPRGIGNRDFWSTGLASVTKVLIRCAFLTARGRPDYHRDILALCLHRPA